jgi:hypothetical protein
MHRFSKAVGLAILMVIAISSGPVWAQRGDDAERLSKNGTTQGVIDGVEVSVEFGRPSVKNRKIWGGLVPFDRIWRTGADEATTIAVSDDVLVEGHVLPAGLYSLFTIPGDEDWTIVFNTVSKQWGAFNYDESKDALRVTVTPRAADFVESLDIQIEGSDVILRWAELAVPIRISTAQ